MGRILLVEDDVAIAGPLARAMERDGHEVDVVHTGREAVEHATSRLPELMLLDLGLPDIDGLEVCRAVRERRPTLAILVLTARAEEIDTVLGLDVGADDYQTKPFRLAELLARIRALLRRVDAAPTTTSAVRVDEGARRAWVGEREIELTPKEFDLLALLVSEAGRVVRRERIMHDVWQTDWLGSTKTLDVHVASLRRKLGEDPQQPRLLTTIRGVGFRFEADVQDVGVGARA